MFSPSLDLEVSWTKLPVEASCWGPSPVTIGEGKIPDKIRPRDITGDWRAADVVERQKIAVRALKLGELKYGYRSCALPKSSFDQRPSRLPQPLVEH